MPIRSKFAGTTPNTAAASTPPETSTFQRLRNTLGFGTRLVGGWASNEGFWPGALIGGGSELLAEGIEGSIDKTSPARIGAEMAIGAVPLHSLTTAGKVLKSIGKNAGFNAAADVGRQYAEGNFDTPQPTLSDLATDRTPQAPGWNPYRTGFAAALGGAVGAATSHFAPRDLKDIVLPPKPVVAPPEVVTNSGEILRNANVARTGGGRQVRLPTNIGATPGSQVDPSQMIDLFEPPAPIARGRVPYGSPEGIGGVPVPQSASSMRAEQAAAKAQALAQEGQLHTVPSQQDVEATNRGFRTRDAYEKEIRRAFDEASQEGRLRELKSMLEGEGQTPTPTYSESLRGYSAEGTPAAGRFKFSAPDEEGAGGSTARRSPGATSNGITLDPVREEIIQKGMSQPEGSKNRAFAEWLVANPNMSIEDAAKIARSGVRPAPQKAVAGITGGVVPGAESGMEIANQSRPGPLGYGGSTPESITYGEHPGPVGYGSGPSPYNEIPGPIGYGSSISGEELANQGRRGPLGYGSKVNPKTGRSPVAPASTEEQGLQDLLNYLQVDEGYRNADAIGRKALGSVFGNAQAQAMASNAAPKLADESGASTLELLVHLAGAATGAGIGAAMDDNGSPIEGALVGGAIGAGIPAIPKLLQSVNLSPEVLNTPEGIKEAAKKIINTIPTYQRAAYLSDLRGIGPNMWAGPYGSMMTGALEAGLKGDQRGWEVIKRFWRPDNFLREWKNAFPEATELIKHGEMGRAEGMAQLSGNLTTGLQAPGVGMTMGDVAARRMLMQAGFSLDEAKTMTLTSEPTTKFGQNFVRGANSTLGSILFPFRRTPINIAEQGATRLPFGVGAVVNALGDNPGSLRDIGVEAGLGTVASGIGYGIGTQMDDPRSTAQNVIRRTASNLGGRYSLPVTLGMFAGQTIGQGKNLTPRNMTQAAEQMVPLPSVGQIVDPAYYLASKLGLTGNENPRPPRGILPFQHLFTNEDTTQRLGRFSRIRKR